MAGNDYCMVQLTAAGETMAGGKPMRVSGRTSVVFTPGEPTRVAKYEWDLMLKEYSTPNGASLFELAPASLTSQKPVAQAAAPTPADMQQKPAPVVDPQVPNKENK